MRPWGYGARSSTGRLSISHPICVAKEGALHPGTRGGTALPRSLEIALRIDPNTKTVVWEEDPKRIVAGYYSAWARVLPIRVLTNGDCPDYLIPVWIDFGEGALAP